jgi:hypothetical protein
MSASATEEFIKRLEEFECPSEDAVASLYDLFAQFDEVSDYTLNIWMVNRILNAAQPPARRDRLMEELNSAASNPKASESTRASAADFLQFQNERTD